MKGTLSILMISATIILSSFGVKKNNSLSDWHIKGRAKTVSEYLTSPAVKGGWSRRWVDSFDENGNILYQHSYPDLDSINIPDSKWRYKYNGFGNKTEEISCSDSIDGWQTMYSYDKSGYLLEANKYYPDGRLVEKYKYNRNDLQLLTGRVSYGSSGAVNYRIEYKYDAVGKLVEEFHDMENLDLPELAKTVFRYDGAGNVVEYIEYSKADALMKIIKNNYTKLDDSGNWTNKTVFESQGGANNLWDTLIYRREITYY